MSEWQRCPVCRGSGSVPGGFYPSNGTLIVEEKCRRCDGEGIIDEDGNPPVRSTEIGGSSNRARGPSRHRARGSEMSVSASESDTPGPRDDIYTLASNLEDFRDAGGDPFVTAVVIEWLVKKILEERLARHSTPTETPTGGES